MEAAETRTQAAIQEALGSRNLSHLTPADVQAVHARLESMRASGRLTDEQHAALSEGLALLSVRPKLTDSLSLTGRVGTRREDDGPMWRRLTPRRPHARNRRWGSPWPWMEAHRIGDEAAVVIGAQLHWAVDGGVDVDAVSPDVASEADVEQVLERRPNDGRTNGIGRYRAGGGVCQRPLTALGPTTASWATALRGQVVALADLQLVEAVDPVVRVDLLVQRHPSS